MALRASLTPCTLVCPTEKLARYLQHSNCLSSGKQTSWKMKFTSLVGNGFLQCPQNHRCTENVKSKLNIKACRTVVFIERNICRAVSRVYSSSIPAKVVHSRRADETMLSAVMGCNSQCVSAHLERPDPWT